MNAMIGRIQEFLKLESAAGLILMVAAVAALVASNSGLAPHYLGFLETPVAVQVGALEIAKPLLLWINDGLMAVFFFLVGLEIKREVLEGELSTIDKAALPVIAAFGGIAVPALIYATINWGNPETIQGWAIPAATDIAFALGILALLGSRVPVSLKIFLLAIAIIDDLAAIVIIAVFYTADLSLLALTLGLAGFAVLMILNRMGVTRVAPYVLVGVVMWVCVLKSGVHATLAGVLTALAVPLAVPQDSAEGKDHSPLRALEHALHPWVAYMVLPLFAFANAGVSLAGVTFAALLAPVPLGIALGLFVGKQVGVMAACALAVKLRLARLPTGAGWAQVYGIACLTGVGFTMSLFIGGLAFDSAETMNQVRLGVIMGSVASALVGYAVLRMVTRTAAAPGEGRAAPAPAE